MGISFCGRGGLQPNHSSAVVHFSAAQFGTVLLNVGWGVLRLLVAVISDRKVPTRYQQDTGEMELMRLIKFMQIN